MNESDFRKRAQQKLAQVALVLRWAARELEAMAGQQEPAEIFHFVVEEPELARRNTGTQVL